MMKKNKNILIYLVIGIVLIVSIFFSFDKKEYHELPKVKLKDDINKNGLAIMVESDYKSGEYQKLDSTIFPTDGYTLNRIKSGCVDKNGKDVDALTYNEDNKTINIKTKQSVYCYLYYDNLFKGKGTEDEPYQINYIEDLVRLSNSVNIDQNNYADKNFILTRDLDFNENESYMKYNDTGFGDINGVNSIEGIKDELTNKEGSGFTSIGNLTTHFQGNFNGNSKKLNNIYEKNKNEADKHLGLFGVLENSIIKDLLISGTIKTDMTFIDIGGIAGESYDNISILNCITDVEVTGVNYSTGGIIGANFGNVTIKDSINKGNITNGINVGGLVGAIGTRENTSITIENSRNEGKITNELGENAGGLLGRDSSENKDKLSVIIKNSYNAGEVTNSKESEGGLVGLVYGAIEIDNSHNEGKISNTLGTYIGGLIGFGTDTSNIIINNSYNKSPISSNTAEELDVNMGGLVGLLNGQTNIKNSYNEGNIENLRTDYAVGSFRGKNIFEGGLIGCINNNKSYIVDSYNTGNLSNGNGSGGIIGIEYSKEILIINRCYNKGKIVALLRTGFNGTPAGGIIGSDNSSKNTYILNSYNTGSLESIYEAGGLIGEVYEGSNGKYYIINSYNLGNASSDRSTGGIFNQYYSSTTHNAGMYYVNNVYNTGTIGGNGSIKYSIGYLNNTVDRTIKNAYYLEGTAPIGTNLENDAELTTPMVESDIKNITFVDALNKNVDELNNAGLETIDEELKGYELEKWGIKVNSYPVLTRKIEDLSGHGNHGLSYAVKYDEDGVTTSIDENNLGYIDAGLRGHNFGNNFTMILKFRFNKILEGYNSLFNNLESGGLGLSVKKSNNEINIMEGVNTVNIDKYYSFTKPYDFKENEWYTMVLIYDGSLASQNLKIYINGNLHDTIDVIGNVRIPAYNVPFVIGAEPAYTFNNLGTTYHNSYATYKEALVFDRALTEEQDHISTNYKDDINVTNQDELLLWYKF